MIGFIILLIIWGIYFFVLKDKIKKVPKGDVDIEKYYGEVIEYLSGDPLAKITDKSKAHVYIKGELGSIPIEFQALMHYFENEPYLSIDLVNKTNNKSIRKWNFDILNQQKIIDRIDKDMYKMMIDHFTKANKMIDKLIDEGEI